MSLNGTMAEAALASIAALSSNGEEEDSTLAFENRGHNDTMEMIEYEPSATAEAFKSKQQWC